MSRSLILLAVVVLLSPMSRSFSQQIPRTQFTTLTVQHIVVPKEASAKPLLLLLTFSHKGSGDVTAWNKHFKIRYETDPSIDYYELSDFQGVPRFIMKMILHGMRRATPEPERSHSAPFYTNEKIWEKLVGYNNPKITYLVLADANGHVVWQTHGPATDAKATELNAAILKLTASSNNPSSH